MNKQLFEWLISDESSWPDDWSFNKWDSLSFSMQWGVYLEFFDSVGIRAEIWIEFDNGEVDFFGVLVNDVPLQIKNSLRFNTRLEAQQAAVKKAFEILDK